MSLGAMFTDNTEFIRKECCISKEQWHKIHTLSKAYSVSSASVLLATCSEVVSRWSSSSDLTMKLIRESSAVPIRQFTDRLRSASTIAYTPVQDQKWSDLCRTWDNQLHHSQPEVDSLLPPLRCTASYSPRQADSLEHSPSGAHGDQQRSSELDVLSQVSVSCHLSEQEERVDVVWDVRNSLFSHETAACMVEAFTSLVSRFIEGEEQLPDMIPEAQRLVRERVNATQVQVDAKLIHADFFAQAHDNPKRKALLWDENEIEQVMTYGELSDKALRLAAFLIAKGVHRGDLVAITLPRGADQIVAVLAVLAAGAAYVPIGISQPAERRDRIYRIGGIRYAIMDKVEFLPVAEPTDMTIIYIEQALTSLPLPYPVAAELDTLAYVIFTSGSTGEPKGVEITHRAAHNTIFDINTRFNLNECDTVLAVSALDFDLSVYDIFGLLSVGGRVALLTERTRREALVWLDQIRRMKVTVWNSVPALFEMLLIASSETHVLTALRLVLVSGDWVGLDLYDRLMRKSEHCRFVALGGATEAAIWSNYYEVKSINPDWNSIPYGTPLSNQCYRVVDHMGRDCPDLVIGELWIGGDGVAHGYLGNEELTERHFKKSEDKRWYRTGDLGRYWPDGNIEFLGRADQQVKLRGYRIELGEIEAALRQYVGVGQAVATISSNAGIQQLIAAVVADSSSTPFKDVLYVPESIEHVRAKDASRELQAQMVEATLVNMLSFETLCDKNKSDLTLCKRPDVADEYESLLHMWLHWLGERNVIVEDEGYIRAGVRLERVLEYAAQLTTNVTTPIEMTEKDSKLVCIEQRLFDRLDDYRRILSGERSAMALFEDDILSPERLAIFDDGTNAGIERIEVRIKWMAKSSGKPVETALLGGRSGMIALKLLELLDPTEIRFTLLDAAPSMVEAAKDRLRRLPHEISCIRLPNRSVPKQLRYVFDAVLAINSLHRYHDPYHGAAVASLLLRRGGKLFALEHSELTPLGFVTSAVLDRGFIEFDHARRQAYSPMLSAQQWAKLFIQAGLHPVSCKSVDHSFSEMIEADCPLSRPELYPDEILQQLATQLPAHMLPENLEVLPWLPLSANGKVDRKAVLHVCETQPDAMVGEQPHEGMEQEVSAMWMKLFGNSSIGRKQGFFEMGGDSLLATRFLTEVKEHYGVELSLRQMFETPALDQIAACIEQQRAEQHAEIVYMEEGEI
ncbi:amino acid adenylation domain-containing protein [Paenibacillus arenosi]|uniref:Amino acid adenylation domain-containing protein n=1 Tax=Paenibacillus arenosi TaxID=2774142 RepID=A0ABR9AYY1_9BACL|nr:amino acid adenylation domain-containing protein [Paenibacillus arenosi]MBD8499359.1 amino acid adenylation domain-containing protein [Paenibacillus arenosi]